MTKPAVVLRRKAVLPQFGVRQPPGAQGFGVAGVRLDPLREMLDHPENALAAHAFHHPAEPLVLFFRWLPVMLLVHDVSSCMSWRSRYRAGPSLRGRRPRMAQAAAYVPDLESVSTGGRPRGDGPSRPLPPAWPLPRPPTDRRQRCLYDDAAAPVRQRRVDGCGWGEARPCVPPLLRFRTWAGARRHNGS